MTRILLTFLIATFATCSSNAQSDNLKTNQLKVIGSHKIKFDDDSYVRVNPVNGKKK